MKYPSDPRPTQAQSPSPRPRRRRPWRWAVWLLLAVAAGYGIKYGRKYVFYDNLGTVEEGKVYRSGQLKFFQLERLIREKGLRTVVALREAEVRDTVIREEEELCRRLGVDLVWIDMPGDGRGSHEAFGRAVKALSESTRQPALVHCARGTHRTGAVVAAYRVQVQGWEADQAMAEMTQYRFRPKGHPLVPWLKEYLEPESPAGDGG